MFEGWINYAGNELVNSARLAAYVDGGIKPPGVLLKGCDECDTLADMAGDGPYNSPLQDDAPWLDMNNPASWRFAGLQILAMTGKQDSTYQAATTELIRNGGYASRGRYATRVMAVSALMIGMDGEAIEAGMQWLKAVLKGDPCGGTTPCTGSKLCLLSGCPEVCDQSTNPDVPMQTYPLELDSYEWTAFGGTYVPDTATYTPPPGGGIIAGPLQTMYDEIEVTFQVQTVGGDPNTVWVGIVNDDGVVLEQGPVQGMGFGGTYTFNTSVAWPKWRPAFFVDGPGVEIQFAEIRHRPYMTTDECIDPYLRMYEQVTTIDGPRIIGTDGDGCEGDGLARVEWTWHIADPAIFHAPRVLVAEMNSGSIEPPVYVATGVRTSGPELVSVAETACATPAPPVSLPGSDPCCSTITPPPTVPTVAEACVKPLQPENQYFRTIVQIPAMYVPSQIDGMLNIAFYANQRPKMNVRVRLYPDPLELGFETVGECDFCAEWNITYLPAGARFQIDAARDRAIIAPAGDTDGYDRSDALRGMNMSPFFDFPALQCGVPYMLVVDVPLLYHKDCLPYYASGSFQGNLLWGLTVEGRQL